MSGSDSDDCQIVEENLPSAAECERRCQRFAEVTGTDTALAMFYLQDRDWNLDKALNAFFEEDGASRGAGMNIVHATASPSTSSCTPQKSRIADSNGSDTVSQPDSEPHRFRLLSWNIDGLDDANLKQRAAAVVDIIKAEKPQVVFVQEMVPGNEAVLRTGLTDYTGIAAGTGDKQGYYCGIFLHKDHTMLDDYNIIPFFNSTMGRNLLIVNSSVKGVPITLMTSHLESTKSHAGERKRQLTEAFKQMSISSAERTVIFGGDLNLRDSELNGVGGIPAGVCDLWEETGRRKEARATWDTFRNDNLNFPFRTALRFDRLYLRHCKSKPRVRPVYFELVGLQRVPGVQRFPSDHWGILVHFDILP